MDVQLPDIKGPRQPWLWLAVVVVLLPLTTILVHVTGGTHTPLPHAFYLPVVLAALVLGNRAGLLTALAAGLLSGPLMPLDVEAGIPQPTSAWLIRTGFFLMVAAVAGLGRARMLEMAESRQRFLSAVSHEVRTPLASILGFSDIVVQRYDELSDEECREFATLVHREAVELSDIIDHYVLAGRMRDAALTIDRVPTDLNQVTEVVLAGIPPGISAGRIHFTGVSTVSLADPLRTRQIVRSLLNNALAYGGERIRVEVAEEQGISRVTVRDETAAAVGRRGSASSEPPPLGLGLAVSRQLARRMGGELVYRLDGALFLELRLPLHRPRARSRSPRLLLQG